ncbi:MAG TPA: epoxide hydrolase [Planctomycetota bacterium]|nr:epoxide hydrolase [Planctomycetota bacterium]
MRRAWLLLGLSACAGAPTPAPSAPDAIRPYKVHVDDAVLADLRDRLARTRWPDQIEGSGWTYGVDVPYMKQLVEYWRTAFDWRAAERRLNAFDQFTTTIDGVELHFIHQRSKHPKALPLVLTHGWPGSVAEFLKVIGPLTDPEAHGGKADDAFHVICPSLPGFGFSSKPRIPGWNVSRMAETISILMDRLGYERYGAQGGDWGRNVTETLGRTDPRVIGIHLQFPPGPTPAGANPFEGLTPEEVDRMKRRNAELQDQRAYGAIQGTRPLTLGFGLNDSPAGLAAWVVDKFWAWSDHGGNLESSFTKDELLTNITIYWVTETMPSSTRIYYESGHPVPSWTSTRPRRAKNDVPAGVALFPKEISVPPRKWVEKVYNLVHWTEMPRGGHFAAQEQPGLLVEDIRKFFRAVR